MMGESRSQGYRRRSSGLWRLLPFAGLLLLAAGIHAYAGEPPA